MLLGNAFETLPGVSAFYQGIPSATEEWSSKMEMMQSGGQSKAWAWGVGLSVDHTAQRATQWLIYSFLSTPQTLPWAPC